MSKYTPLRNYIYDRLYHPTHGYFCKPNFQVGELKAPIDFKSLIGYDDYQRELAKKYPPNAWLTPCEIFKPYYGMTIASYLKAAHERYHSDPTTQKLKIVEAGAGTGSAAQSIIYYFANFHRELLPQLQYSIVQISPPLCKRIQEKLSKTYPSLLKSRQIKIINQDISEYKEKEQCFALFFEVLDNMPHDKVIWNPEQKAFDSFVTVDIESNEESQSDIQSDGLVKECLDLYLQLEKREEKNEGIMDRIAMFLVDRMVKKTQFNSKDVFLPTFMLRLLKRINKNMPNCHLVISDFDHLVTPIPGINAPIVSRKGFKSQQKTDFDSYLVKRGEADIFFPVDFKLLTKMHSSVLGREARVVKSFEFIGEFSEQSWAQTKSSFNPIREDFGNTSFLVTQVPPKKI